MNHEHSSQKIYTCPMHPEIIRDVPGICPECGMNLVPIKKKDRLGHERDEFNKHAGHSTEMFFRKFWVSLFLTIPVVFYSDIFAELFGWRAPSFYGSEFMPAIFGSIVFFYGGWIFLASAWRELRARLPGMMTLIALAISAAYLYSVFGILSRNGHTLFWELTTLITIMLLGHWLEMRAVSGAQSALKELSKLLPDTAEVIREGKQETISLSELREGDTAFVRPGGRIPADGIVLEGRSEANESMITGESQPVKKSPDSEVIAGTINGDGSLKIKVAKVGEHTFLAGVMRLVEEAQASKSRLQVLSDKAAFYLTVVAIGAGSLTFVLWLFAKAGFGFALERMVAVLVITCPHALGLAVPLVASISTTLAARHGFLVKQRLALEAARNIQVVLFDKTGTLTKGEYGITKIIPNDKIQMSNDELLRLAAAVDAHSEHFVSKAIVRQAEGLSLPLAEVKDFTRLPGKGVRGAVNGQEIFVGGAALLEDLKIIVPEAIKTQIEEENRRGRTIIYVIRQGSLLGAFALGDVVREESRQAIRELKALGVKVAMITGDSEDVASRVAQELGIDEYFARVLPAEKASIVRKLQASEFGNWKLEIGNSRQRRVVAMVGDGINDAPALTQADLGVAIGAGTNVAIESAGIILVRNDPRDIVKIIRLSRLTYTKMIQNLFWATGYNIIALPLAAGALAWRGILLQPALAALLMSVSTIIVAVNAVFLKRAKL